MYDSKTSPTPGEAGFSSVTVVGWSGLVESVEVQGLLPGFTEEKQVDVVVE